MEVAGVLLSRGSQASSAAVRAQNDIQIRVHLGRLRELRPADPLQIEELA